MYGLGGHTTGMPLLIGIDYFIDGDDVIITEINAGGLLYK